MEQTEETHSPQEITRPIVSTKAGKLVVSWSDFSRKSNVESWTEFGRNNNRFKHAHIEEVCTNEGEGSGEFNMEQTEETHSPQNTTITKQGGHRQNQALVINPYKQRTEMMCTTGIKPKIEASLRAKLKSIKSKFKRNVAETNWHNRALIKEFSALIKEGTSYPA